MLLLAIELLDCILTRVLLAALPLEADLLVFVLVLAVTRESVVSMVSMGSERGAEGSKKDSSRSSLPSPRLLAPEAEGVTELRKHVLLETPELQALSGGMQL